MNDFDAFIKRALENGLSNEEIAAQFTEAMNKTQAVNKSKKEREDYLAKTRASVLTAINRGDITFETATQTIILAAAAKYPEWSVELFGEYLDIMSTILKESAKMFDSLVNDEDSGLSDIVKNFIFSDGEDKSDAKVRRFLMGLS